eukprot:COSAG01_NODE_206_length_22034_cov_125.512585_12_plen_70_part_00
MYVSSVASPSMAIFCYGTCKIASKTDFAWGRYIYNLVHYRGQQQARPRQAQLRHNYGAACTSVSHSACT